MFVLIHLEWNYFYILIFFIINLFEYLLEKQQNEMTNPIKNISFFCLIIFYFIEKFNSKKKTNDLNIHNQKVFIIREKSSKKRNYDIFIISLCFLVLYIMAEIPLERLMKDNIFNVDILFQIPFLILLKNLFHKKKFYSHHLFSMIINGILSILILLLYYNELKHFYISTLFLFLDCYCYSFYLLLIEYLNYKYYISIYLLGSLVGISRFFYFIILIIMRNIHFEKIEYRMILIFVNYIINQYLYFTIIIKCSPIHAIIGECISMILVTLFIDKKTTNKIIFIILSFIYLLSILVFMEIIELNFCNLNNNLKIKIESRANKENDKMNEMILMYKNNV